MGGQDFLEEAIIKEENGNKSKSWKTPGREASKGDWEGGATSESEEKSNRN